MESKFSKKLILHQLSRVCSSGELKSKYRLCSLLEYLVGEKLAGRENQIKNYTIGLKVFYRDKDFNPELDPIVRIEMGRLRRSLDKYYSNEGKNDQVRFFIPLGKYIPVFKSNDKIQSQSNQEEKNRIHYVSRTKPSIIILPFENITNEREYEYFVNGFTEELSIELTHYEDFKVIGYRVKNTDAGIRGNRKLLQKLNADFSISGSIRRDEKQIKVTVKLCDVNTDEQLWGEQFKYDLNPANLIQAQEEIACKAVTIIANEYGIISQRISQESRGKPPNELNSYEAILRFYNYEIYHTSETAMAAFSALEQAILKDPEYATAIAMLAGMYGTRYLLDVPGSENARERTVELAKKAMSLEPDNQIVRISYAWSNFIMNEKDTFLSEINNALGLNPHSPFRVGAIGFFLSLYGKWDQGKALLDKAMKQSIGFPQWFHGAATVYYYRLKEYDKAYEEAVKYNVLSIFWGSMLRIATLGQLGRTSDAKKDISELKALRPDFEKKARYLISRYVKEDELVEHIIEGLKKAGLNIS